MTTKEKILAESLRLFSQQGYDATGMEEIAAAVGIKAPSIYKHYQGKQAILSAIFEEVSRRFDGFPETTAGASAAAPQAPGQQASGQQTAGQQAPDRQTAGQQAPDRQTAGRQRADDWKERPAEALIRNVREVIGTMLHDEYISGFRKMLSIEQFSSPALSELYSQKYVRRFYDYYKTLFARLIVSGVLRKENPEMLAVFFASPVIVAVGECDRRPEREAEQCRRVEEQIRLFCRTFCIKGGI